MLDNIHISGSDDQTTIVGISGTVAEFDTAITDATLSGNNTGDQTIPVSTVDFDPVGTDNSTNELSTNQLAAILSRNLPLRQR